jgi:hypothetical protein
MQVLDFPLETLIYLPHNGQKRYSVKEIERLNASYKCHRQRFSGANIIEVLGKRIVQRWEAT